MPLVLVRVDCRLVHGQVVETWLPHTGANCILIANNELAGNPFLRSVMELAVPQTVHLVFCRLDQVAKEIEEVDNRGERAILLCSTFADALRIYNFGTRFASVNVGNLHYATGKVEISPSVYFSTEDFEAVQDFRGHGVAVDVRATPFDPVTPC